MPARRGHGDDQRGMTLLEIMMVLAVMAGMMFLGYYTVRAVSKSQLRTGTVEVASALKSARNLAAETGVHHRVVFNLDEQTYRIEACPDPIQLKRGKEEEKVDQEAIERLAQQPNPLQATAQTLGAPPMGLGAALGEVSEAESPDAAFKAAAALSGVRIGASRCGVAPASGGDVINYADPQAPNVHKIEGGGSGIKLRRVYVQHLRDAAATGEVSINFFPLGQSEKAVIELSDEDGTGYSVVLHGLTGRVEVADGEIDADKHMRRNAVGEEVEQP